MKKFFVISYISILAFLIFAFIVYSFSDPILQEKQIGEPTISNIDGNTALTDPYFSSSEVHIDYYVISRELGKGSTISVSFSVRYYAVSVILLSSSEYASIISEDLTMTSDITWASSYSNDGNYVIPIKSIDTWYFGFQAFLGESEVSFTIEISDQETTVIDTLPEKKLLLMTIISLVVIVGLVIFSKDGYEFYIKYKQEMILAKEEGYNNRRVWNKAKKIGAKNIIEYEGIKRGEFFTREEWIDAKEKGFKIRGNWLYAQKLGALNPTELTSIYTGDFNSRTEWLEASKKGFNNKIEFLQAQEYGALNPDELSLILEGEFNSRTEWLEAKKRGMKNYVEYEVIVNTHKISNVIMELTPSIPVSISKIAELSNIKEDKTELIVKKLAEETSIGKYLAFEEVFIRSPSKITLGSSTNQLCMICQKEVYINENFGACPYCDGIAHTKEFIEWITTKSVCPACRKQLKEEDIVIASQKANS